tara:strand:- start:819 stop:1064 length:246 start_codon:yes stop_codon:yes gene_type:complete
VEISEFYQELGIHNPFKEVEPLKLIEEPYDFKSEVYDAPLSPIPEEEIPDPVDIEFKIESDKLVKALKIVHQPTSPVIKSI